MHIVIDARIISSTTGTYVERLLHYLQKIDSTHRYTILVPSKDLGYFKPTSPNFSVRPADFANYSLAEQTKFKAFLDTLNADLVHFCMPQQPVLYGGAHVTTIHDLTLLNTYNTDKNWLVYHIKQLIGRFVFKAVIRSSKHIITPTQFVKQQLLDFTPVDPDKITVTYEAADVAITTISPYPHPFKRFILYVGQQSDYKNIKRLGDAHQQLLKAHPDLGLILVGKKNKAIRSNEAYFAAKGYKNILFTDFISNEQRDWLYTQCAAYVFPSLMEGFGLPGLEAMAYGAPVISSNATCLPEVYGDAAHYFDPKNTDDMARAINDVLADSTLRTTLAANGAEQCKKYSWERMAQQTHSVYLEALTSSRDT